LEILAKNENLILAKMLKKVGANITQKFVSNNKILAKNALSKTTGNFLAYEIIPFNKVLVINIFTRIFG
jgi:hypothetical protein